MTVLSQIDHGNCEWCGAKGGKPFDGEVLCQSCFTANTVEFSDAEEPDFNNEGQVEETPAEMWS